MKKNEIVCRWIPCSERMPEERETIFSRLYGTENWRPGMFCRMSDDVRTVVKFADGTRMVSHDHTIDGKWASETRPVGPNKHVLYWMENPPLPEESR